MPQLPIAPGRLEQYLLRQPQIQKLQHLLYLKQLQLIKMVPVSKQPPIDANCKKLKKIRVNYNSIILWCAKTCLFSLERKLKYGDYQTSSQTNTSCIDCIIHHTLYYSAFSEYWYDLGRNIFCKDSILLSTYDTCGSFSHGLSCQRQQSQAGPGWYTNYYILYIYLF